MLVVSTLLTSAALLTPNAAPKLSRTAVSSSSMPFGDPLNLLSDSTTVPSASGHGMLKQSEMVGLAALVAAAQPEAAMAKGGEYGIFEGRIVSLAHPAIMALMYGASAYAAFTGLQWRRLREIGNEITDLKAELKGPQAAVAAAEEKEETPSAAQLTAVRELTAKIDELTATRKDLADSKFRDAHYQVGSVILGLGTAFAIEGPVNTFLRAQKLFPGPHLYAGAGVVVCWAMAASLVPLMSKGNDNARVAHMSFNVLALGLFTWQLPTGWEIMLKVIKFTKFP